MSQLYPVNQQGCLSSLCRYFSHVSS